MTTTHTRAPAMPKWIRRRSVKIVLDTSLFVAFVAEFVTQEGPDDTIHSRVRIALVPIIARLRGRITARAAEMSAIDPRLSGPNLVTPM